MKTSLVRRHASVARLTVVILCLALWPAGAVDGPASHFNYFESDNTPPGKTKEMANKLELTMNAPAGKPTTSRLPNDKGFDIDTPVGYAQLQLDAFPKLKPKTVGVNAFGHLTIDDDLYVIESVVKSNVAAFPGR